MKPEEVIAYFNIEGAVKKIAPFGLGHINDTFKVESENGSFLLQKVNTNVFRYADILEENISHVLNEHPDLFPKLFKTKEEKYHLVYDRSCWRLQEYLADTYSPNEVHHVQEVESIGMGYAQFSNAFLKELPETFKETIPNFHDLRFRLHQLEKAIQINLAERLELVSDLVLKAYSFKWIVERFEDLIAQGLSKRLCHNDAKTANILLQRSDHSFSKIIDLDTIGPGYLLYDYGDIMRSLFTIAAENELELKNLKVRPEYFGHLKKSFLSVLQNELTALEVSSLEFGGLYMTYIMGVRFLTDFLEGDTYYKTLFANENMIRARNQFRLLELMEEALEENYR